MQLYSAAKQCQERAVNFLGDKNYQYTRKFKKSNAHKFQLIIYKCNNNSEGHSIKDPAQGLVQTLIDISNCWVSTNET